MTWSRSRAPGCVIVALISAASTHPAAPSFLSFSLYTCAPLASAPSGSSVLLRRRTAAPVRALWPVILAAASSSSSSSSSASAATPNDDSDAESDQVDGMGDYYRSDGVRIAHDPFAPGMAEKYGTPGATDHEGFDPYADTVGPGIYGGIVKRDGRGEVVIGRQYQNHNPRPGASVRSKFFPRVSCWAWTCFCAAVDSKRLDPRLSNS